MCGVADIGGWTVPVPSKVDTSVPLKDLKQPGSRLIYISAATGSDSTGRLYFWNGSQIIDELGRTADDSGQPYGTDPMNPSVAVKPFKRWSYVGPRSNGGDIGSTGTVGGATPSTRAGFPDWWMFKRGETYNLSQDLLSFERQTNASATQVNSSLAVPGGRSATERQVVGAWGDLCLPRPRFVHPQLGFVSVYQSSYSPALKNVAYLSLHFDGHDRSNPGSNYTGITLYNQTDASVNILFEDIWIDATSVNIQNGAQVTLRRSLVTDAYNTDNSHTQGVYYGGTRKGQFRIEESILMRNGFAAGDPAKMAWPPTGSQIWNLYNRNLYISGETNSMQSGMFDSVSMMGASGDQFRPGARLERNFFYQGYVGIGAHGGYPDSEGPTGAVVDNVLQRFTGTGTNDNRGQPNWGFMLGGGAYAVEVTRNIVTGAQWPASSFGIELRPVWQDCEVPFKYATRGNKIFGNVLDTGSASAAVRVTDGADPCYGAVLPGVKGNTISGNTLINSASKEWEYAPVLSAIGTTTDTLYQGNKTFASRAAAASALGWAGADRTLKSYVAGAGVAVSSQDGFPEYFAQAVQQRRGKWRAEWTSKPLVNHFRTGFGMEPLP